MSEVRDAWLRALEATAGIGAAPRRTLAAVIDEGGLRFGDAPAILSDEGCLSHRELAARCRAYARWARAHGLGRGHVAGLLMENGPDYLAAWVGLTRAGAVVALLNTQLRGAALAHALALAGPAQVLVGASLWDELAPEIARRLPGACAWRVGGGAGGEDIDAELARLAVDGEDPPDEPALADTALYIYTSGTTGMPKAARISHYRVLQWSHWFAGMAGTGPADRLYDCLPMYHSVGGIVAPGSVLVRGGAVAVARRFSASGFWSDVHRWDCTLFQYIGELCRILALAPSHPLETAHRLRMACGNGLAADVWKRFQARFRIPRILEFYAATEANFSLYNCEGRVGSLGRVPPFFAHRFPLALVRHDAATGAPARGTDGRCLACMPGEAGEAISPIGRQAAPRFEGYTDAAATEAKILRDVFEAGDAWYRSGDLMRRDAAGFYYFVDRVGDTFRWKGENVSTTEVAAALCACPGVAEALVYGVAVPASDGRAGMAALATADGFDIERLRRHAQSALPPYARPQFLRLLAKVERTATFKPAKHELARAGFDPALVADPIYVSDAAADRYVPVDGEVLARIHAGGWRFD